MVIYHTVRDAWHVSGLTDQTHITLARLPFIKREFETESNENGSNCANRDLEKV